MGKAKNKRKRSTEIKNTQFMISWLIASVLVCLTAYGMAVAIFVMIIVPGIQLSIISFNLFSDLFNKSLSGFLQVLCIGTLIGLSIGILQKIVIRRFLHADVNRWRLYSVVGGLISTVIVFFAPFTLYDSSFIGYDTIIAIIIGVALTGVGIGQWFQLRRFVHGAWLWILANTMGGITFTMLISNSNLDLFGAILVASRIGLLTGVPLLWLFKNRRIPQTGQYDASEDSSPLFEQPSQSDDSDLSHLIEPDQLDIMTTGS